LLQRKSAEEERFEKIGKFVAIGMLLFGTAVTLLLTPAQLSFMTRLMGSLFIGLLSGTAVYALFHHLSNRATLPQKKAILNTAHITSFSWRTTTFAFTNETFTERFKSINKSLLMHIV
jgi:succinate dehydrogenase/fumarate reductase cytochrome b subunit